MSSLRQSVADLFGVLLLLGAADALVLVLSWGQSLLRTAVVLPLLLFLPGYALVSVFYPDLPDSDPKYRQKSNAGWSLTGIERISLAVAASLCIVPLVGLVMNFTPYGIRLIPVFVGVSAVTAVLTLLAFVQRLRTDPERRFRVPVFSWLASAPRRYLDGSTRGYQQRFPFEAQNGRQRTFNLLLVASLLLLASSVGYAAVGPTLPSDDDSFTELYLLSENETGELLARDYPRNLSQGESAPVTVAIENHENEDETYTAVVEAQQVAVGDGERRVVAQTELSRFEKNVPAGERATVRTQLSPALSADRQRVVVLLYRDDVPADPSSENAYRAARVWVSTDGGSGGGSGGSAGGAEGN